MSDTTISPQADDTAEPTGTLVPAAPAAPSATPDPLALVADVDKWKALARQHEKAAKARAKELDDVRTANLSDAEKAIEQARTEGRSTALAEVGSRLAGAELRAQAATAGVDLPDLEFLALGRFLTEAGDVDTDAVTAFVGSLTKAEPAPAAPQFAQGLGLGRQEAAGPVMDPKALADMVNAVSPF